MTELMQRFKRSAPAFIRKRALREQKGASLAEKIVTADSLRDAGRWREAAEHYLQIASMDAGKQDYWVQAGNCLKEAGLFSSAFDAFLMRLGFEQNDGDCQLQFGHLLKVSGNLQAGLQAYRRGAASGETRCEPEIEGFSDGADAIRIGRTGSSVVPVREGAVTAFTSLLACNFGGGLNPDALRRASLALARWGEKETGLAFGELAFLVDRRADALDHHIRFIFASDLWPVSYLKPVSEIRVPCAQIFATWEWSAGWGNSLLLGRASPAKARRPSRNGRPHRSPVLGPQTSFQPTMLPRF